MPKISQRTLDEKIKMDYLQEISGVLTTKGDEVLRVGSNEIALPCVDEIGGERWLVVTFKIPTGSRDGDEYDGYSMAQDYQMKCAEKAEKAKVAAEKKAAKIAKDEATRKAKAEAKAKREMGE